jgi:PAS domain S-box-containing protein
MEALELEEDINGMSDIINNREYRQKVLKELINELHNGKNVEEVQERFHDLVHNISTKEISEMEAALIKEGMPVEEIQRLCDVHAAVFKGSIEEIHHPDKAAGHPIHTFKLENEAVRKYIYENVKKNLEDFKENDNKDNRYKLIENFNMLWDLDKHYSRKENLLFPYLEKYGVTAPPKVMWGVDDEVRAGIKETKSMLQNDSSSKENIISKIDEITNKIQEMIFKEENILFPLSIDSLTEDEWYEIESDSDSIGYCLTGPADKWKPARADVEAREQEKKLAGEDSEGYIKFDTGILKAKEISAIFDHLPVDITFVDKDGVVKYFSNSKERIFIRTKAVIGRKVQNCHPPASVHVVEQVAEDLRAGKKEHEDFWIKMGDLYILIRYFAVRDDNSEFLGILEVSQNIKPIQEITGEKRLISD